MWKNLINFGFLKKYRISWLPKEILDFVEGLFFSIHLLLRFYRPHIYTKVSDRYFALNDRALHAIALKKISLYYVVSSAIKMALLVLAINGTHSIFIDALMISLIFPMDNYVTCLNSVLSEYASLPQSVVAG